MTSILTQLSGAWPRYVSGPVIGLIVPALLLVRSATTRLEERRLMLHRRCV